MTSPEESFVTYALPPAARAALTPRRVAELDQVGIGALAARVDPPVGAEERVAAVAGRSSHPKS